MTILLLGYKFTYTLLAYCYFHQLYSILFYQLDLYQIVNLVYPIIKFYTCNKLIKTNLKFVKNRKSLTVNLCPFILTKYKLTDFLVNQ